MTTGLIRFADSTTMTTAPGSSFKIGQHYQGGSIVYIDSTGNHGLISDVDDLGQLYAYSSNSDTVTGATSIWDGFTNKNKIVDVSGATYACKHLNKSGHSDWYLPSIMELSMLFKNTPTAQMNTALYWSSTEFNHNTGLIIGFDNGVFQFSKTSKVATNNIRCVRRF